MATTIRHKKLFCLNCGGDFALKDTLPVSELSQKMNAFDKLHKDCPKTWTQPVADQSQNTNEKAMWWIANGEVGLSSKTMWLCFMGQKISRICYPSDPDDFKRCRKLLDAVPEWKSELHKLKPLSKEWSNLVDNWDKLNNMYEKNQAENWKNHETIGMYEFMQTLFP